MDTVTQEERKRILMRAFVEQGDCGVVFNSSHKGYAGSFMAGVAQLRVDSYVDLGTSFSVDDEYGTHFVPYLAIMSLIDLHRNEWYVFANDLQTQDVPPIGQLFS